VYWNLAAATGHSNVNLRIATDSVNSGPMVPKVCPADSKGSATSSQGIGGCISALAILTVIFLIKGTMLCEK
jgi:hypothetical protein